MGRNEPEIERLKERLRESESSRTELEDSLEQVQESIQALSADFHETSAAVSRSIIDFKALVEESEIDDEILMKKISDHLSLYSDFILQYSSFYEMLIANNRLYQMLLNTSKSDT